ncbi:sensor histidine kinase [Dactylosporangium salmoneum]|uniref:histidine kinase n=1 Tax=Dactylosporangium salmoneum TaxID=53361 RepID=A0ABN3H0Z4_9ACTN
MQLSGRLAAAIDAAAVVPVGAACLAAAYAAPEAGGPHEPGWVSVVVALAISAPVAVRRRWPYAAAAVATLAAAAALVTQVIPSFAGVAPGCALALVFYSLGAAAPNRWGLTAAAAGAVLAGVGVRPPTVAVFFGLAAVGPAFALGYVVAERRAQAALRDEQLVRQATVEERLRVARELHDVVAHTMTLIVVKASIANHVAEKSPAEARDALRVIETAGREAMLEVRRMLDMLREDTPDAPVRGLRDLPELASLATVGGVEVRLELDPPDAALPEAEGLAVYRIVQESLTNVVKHAAPARCRVRVEVRGGEVGIEVTDDGGRAAAPGRAGHGLIGMRERAAMHGGTFAAGPRPGGGFAVRARLPVGAARD